MRVPVAERLAGERTDKTLLRSGGLLLLADLIAANAPLMYNQSLNIQGLRL